MNTPAHLLIGLALCSRRSVPKSGRAAALGSLMPDLSLYVMAGVSLYVLQISPSRVFNELYFSDAWQTVFAIDNSFLLWGLGIAVALALRNWLFLAFASAGFLHVATDFPLHNDDARPHFWPVSDWVFASPLSYWDSDHFAGFVAPLELLCVLIAALVLWRRWPGWAARIGVAVVCLLEVWVVRQWLLFF